MAIPVAIPRLGWNMEEGTFGGWLKNEGDRVDPGDRLFTLESEKAAEEIETLDGGLLHIRADGPKVGDVLPVGTVIGYLLAPGESIVVEKGEIISPDNKDIIQVVRCAPASAPQSRAGSTISPRARRLANELGIDSSTIQGTGRDGRIRERDIRAVAESRLACEPTAHTLSGPSASRRVIAARMLESQRLTAPVTLSTTVDATNVVRLRERLKSSGDAPSYTDIIVKACAAALKLYPMLGAQWADNGIQLPRSLDIGIAVDTDDGLRVPVIRNVANIELNEVARQSRILIDSARAGKLSLADMQGGCFTVTNLGAFGIDAFTPIINYPECAILGVGRIAKRPAVIGDSIVPRDQVTLSLTFDHRIVDGAPAARFLQSIAKVLENCD